MTYQSGEEGEEQYMTYRGRVGEVIGYQIRNGRTIGVLDYHQDMGEVRGYVLRFPNGNEGLFPAPDCKESTAAEYTEQMFPPTS
jgi:hypothetical protein